MKQVKSISKTFAEHSYELKLTFDDDSSTYILVEPGMIFVSSYTADELTKRIEADETDFESYDTSDLCDYYNNSEYREYIAYALLDIMNSKL